MNDIWLWMRGPDGLAAAQWAAAALAIVAIVFALVALHIENKRAGDALVREQARERELLERLESERLQRQRHFVTTVLRLIDKALDIMRHDLPDMGQMYISWTLERGKPFQLEAVRSSLEVIRPAAGDDVDMVLSISEATTILDAAINAPVLVGSAAVQNVLTVLKERADALQIVRDKILAGESIAHE